MTLRYTFIAIVTLPASLTNCTWSINVSTCSIAVWGALKRTVFTIFAGGARLIIRKTKKISWRKNKMTLMWWCKFLTIVTMFSNKTVLTTVRTNPINMVTLFVVYTMTSAKLSTIHPKVTGSTFWFKWNAICIIYKDYMYKKQSNMDIIFNLLMLNITNKQCYNYFRTIS